jgi:agmatinase
MSDNFGDLEKDFSAYRTSKAVILPLSYEGTVTYGKGTGHGPQAIVQASRQLELYDEELDQETFRIGIHTLREIEGSTLSPEEMTATVYRQASPLVKDKKFLVALGGEHSLSLGPVRALSDKYKDLSVLQLDAHADLRNEYQGTKYNHACIGRRILELAPLTQVGIRSLSQEEADYLKSRKRLKVFYASRITGRRDWMEEVISSLSSHVYLTFDLDVLDPGIMPAVGTPEPGGLGWYETLAFLRRLTRKKKIVSFDLMELSPQPENIAPDFLAAKLVYKLLGYIFRILS